MRFTVLLIALLAQASQPTFKSGVNLVEVDVVVTDKAGQPVRGLTREDFEVLEDGKNVGIEAFTTIDLPATPANKKVGSLDRSAASTPESHSAARGTKQTFEGTGAPTWARCRGASSKACGR